MKSLRLAALACGVLLTAAACGGEDGTSTSTQPSPNQQDAFRTCMEKQGVKLPNRGTPQGRPTGRPTNRPTGRPTDRPTGMPSGRPPGARPSMSPEQQKAMKACASLAPNRGGAPEAP